MKNIAVVGLGKVGSLVATLLSENFTVTGIDQRQPADAMPFDIATGNVTDAAFIKQTLTGKDAVVSCLPYSLNLPIAQAAFELGIHYFDLTEDVPTTAAIREMAKTAKGAMVPQCGLAPGFIGIVGANLYNKFTKLRDVELRVGALPKYPNGQMAYSFTWSPAGVINEYINDAEVIHNGVRKMVSSLDGLEMINIEGRDFEAFTTQHQLYVLCLAASALHRVDGRHHHPEKRHSTGCRQCNGSPRFAEKRTELLQRNRPAACGHFIAYLIGPKPHGQNANVCQQQFHF